MMHPTPLHALILSLSIAIALQAEEPSPWLNKKVPQLVLADGKTYTGVTFTKIEADAVTISHAGGIARVPMESLHVSAQEALGYDPEKAAAARKKFLEAKAAAEMANAQRVMAEREAASSKAAAESRMQSAQVGTFMVGQVLEEEGGYLVYKHTRGGAAGSAAQAVASIMGRSGGTFVPAKTDDTPIFLRGAAEKVIVDDDIIDVRYVPTEETFSYESLSGTTTVRVYDLIAVAGE